MSSALLDEKLDIVEVKKASDLDRFLDYPLSLYKDNPHYIPQLKMELKGQFSSKNPFFDHAEATYFLAIKKNRICGRIAAIANHRHLEFHQDGAGFFGFFESEDNDTVAQLLLNAAEGFLRHHGVTVMRGPMNFSTNEECGFLLDGYDSDPMLMMPYNPPYYHRLMNVCGMKKAKDLYAYIHYIKDSLPEKVVRVAAIAEKRGITVRHVDKKRFHEEMQVFKEVYNSAWGKNWGFIPLTDRELNYLGERLKQVIVPEFTLIAEDKGLPVGFMGFVPDFNQVVKHMNGRVNPVTIVKAFWYSRKISDLRLLLLGIRKQYRNKGVDALMFRKGFEGLLKKGRQYKRVEFSWILEDNIPVQLLIEMFGGKLYKRYRIYERKISV